MVSTNVGNGMIQFWKHPLKEQGAVGPFCTSQACRRAQRLTLSGKQKDIGCTAWGTDEAKSGKGGHAALHAGFWGETELEQPANCPRPVFRGRKTNYSCRDATTQTARRGKGEVLDTDSYACTHLLRPTTSFSCIHPEPHLAWLARWVKWQQQVAPCGRTDSEPAAGGRDRAYKWSS